MVFKAELRPAEVDPGFDICRVVNEPLQKKVKFQYSSLAEKPFDQWEIATY